MPKRVASSLVLRSLPQVPGVTAHGAAEAAVGAVAAGTTLVGAAAADVEPGFRHLRRLRGLVVAAAVGEALAGVPVAGMAVAGMTEVGMAGSS
jgi:hypothetical protein